MRLPRPHVQAAIPARGLAAAGAIALLAACETGTSRARADSVEVAAADTAPVQPAAAPQPARTAPAAPPASRRVSPPPRLSPLVDSIGAYLVFAPAGESWFTAASRARRMFVDIGRVDIEVSDAAHRAAYREAVEARSTVRAGTRFRLRGPWGAEDVTATGVDTWNGRVVLRLIGSKTMDSLARGKPPLVASAFRTDSSAEPARDTCDRVTPLAPEVLARVAHVRDSLERVLREGAPPPYERLRRRLTAASSQVTGCFGASRVALVVTLRAGNAEWVRERLVLLDETGQVTPLQVDDYRFPAHELLQAFDADGDGVDDLATRATRERAGATTVLVLDLAAKRLTRLTAGFAWEEQ